MKTSEFIEKFNGVLNNLKAIRLDGGVSLDGDNGREYVIEDYEMIPILGAYSLDIDQLSLITEYMATPIEKREPERKWVVPFGNGAYETKNHFQRLIANKQVTLHTSDEDDGWKHKRTSQFTDSELEALKRSQPDPIAQAIDLMKEPAPEAKE